jgi:hypothetical protein
MKMLRLHGTHSLQLALSKHTVERASDACSPSTQSSLVLLLTAALAPSCGCLGGSGSV